VESYRFLRIPMASYGFLWIPMDSWIPKDSDAFWDEKQRTRNRVLIAQAHCFMRVTSFSHSKTSIWLWTSVTHDLLKASCCEPFFLGRTWPLATWPQGSPRWAQDGTEMAQLMGGWKVPKALGV
jgi:hypothetical protein